jgi:hypothetical protein
VKIAFIHYHLKTGGVTTVIRQQLDALQDVADVMVLSGEPPEAGFPASVAVIPEIGYDGTHKSASPQDVAETIHARIRSKWRDGCDILHVHNPLLKKNSAFLQILKLLQTKGVTFLLQIHDFAEDGRPHSYYKEAYPSDCHYGVINTRDYDILLQAGLKSQGLHKVFNTVKQMPVKSQGTINTNFVLYPIRAIRRKNLGEAILIAHFLPQNMPLFITLPPNSPVDMAAYQDWKHFVKDRRLPVVFDTGLYHPFHELTASADFLITTSITEGFGFSFLEPWTAEKLLWGRDLPDVTRDFRDNGIRLDHLYSKLAVPTAWIRIDRLHERWKACVLSNGHRFQTKIDETDIKNAFAGLIEKEHIDFGLLNESTQKKIITKLLSTKQMRAELIRLNPFLLEPGKVPAQKKLIAWNRAAILDRFSKTKYRENLLNVYQAVKNRSIQHEIDKRILLRSFFDLSNFSMLKWGSYVV